MPLKPTGSLPPAQAAAPEPRSRESLVAELAAPDANRRRQAAQALAGHRDAVEDLCRRLEQEEDVAVWDAILTTLVRTGGPQALQGLLRFLRAEPAQLRNEVLEALKTFPEEEILPAIEKLLADPDPHLRIAVIHLIQALGYPAGVNTLTSILEREEHINVAATAVDLLAEMGTQESAPSLEQARVRFSGIPFLVFAIDTALSRIRSGKTQ